MISAFSDVLESENCDMAHDDFISSLRLECYLPAEERQADITHTYYHFSFSSSHRTHRFRFWKVKIATLERRQT